MASVSSFPSTEAVLVPISPVPVESSPLFAPASITATQFEPLHPALVPTAMPLQQPARTRICVYCGSLPGSRPVHLEAARELARAMARHDIDLVYGGGTIGMMGELAKTLVSLAGPDAVHGIIPRALAKHERDGTYQSVDFDDVYVPTESLYGRTTVVQDMHSRKQRMAQEVFSGGPGSGFVALTGGFGTLEEVLETTTWNVLGIHQRGVCLINVAGYFDGLLAWIDTAVREGFVRPENAAIVMTAADAEGAIRALRDCHISSAALKLDWGPKYFSLNFPFLG